MTIELAGLEKSNVLLGSCSELKHHRHELEYRNYFVPSSELNGARLFIKDVQLEVPYRIDISGDSIMVAKINNRCKRIRAPYGELLALFVLVRRYQNGTLHCKYCKRVVPDQCQIAGLLNFLLGLASC